MSSSHARAVRAADEGDWEAAAVAYEEAAREDNDAQLWIALGRVRLRLNEPVSARAAFEQAIQVAGDSPQVRVLIGRSHELQRHYDEALVAYRQATVLAPEQAFAWRFAGARLLRWGQPEEAAPLLLRAVELEPTHAETWNALAIAQAQSDEQVMAIATFKRALLLHPQHRGLHLGLAATLINAGQLRDALATYNEVIAAWPDYAAAHVGRALLLDALGDPVAAEHALAKAAALDPKHQERLVAYRRRVASPAP